MPIQNHEDEGAVFPVAHRGGVYCYGGIISTSEIQRRQQIYLRIPEFSKIDEGMPKVVSTPFISNSGCAANNCDL